MSFSSETLLSRFTGEDDMGLVLKFEFSLKTILPSLLSFPDNLGMEILGNFAVFEIVDKIKMLFG